MELLAIFGTVLGLLFALALLGQSYDAFRSAWKGIQPEASAPEADPKSLSARAGGFVWGIMALLLALLFVTVIAIHYHLF